MKYANFKRMAAIAMATAMMCSPLTAMAGNSPTLSEGFNPSSSAMTGVSDLKYLDKNIKKSYVQTFTSAQLKFTLDPQGLLGGVTGGGFTDGAGAVYFANTGGTYSSTSDSFKIYNGGSVKMDAVVSVEVTLPEGVSLAKDISDLANATEPMVYLALKGVNTGNSRTAKDHGVAKALAVGTNSYDTLTAKEVEEVKATEQNQKAGYYVKVEGSGIASTYTYELSDKFKTDGLVTSIKPEGVLEYVLTGACSKDADGWKDVSDLQNPAGGGSAITAEIKVTYTLAESTIPDETTVTANEVAVDSITKTGDTVEVVFPFDETLDKVQWSADGTNWTDLTEDTDYELTAIKYGQKIVFKDLTGKSGIKYVKVLAKTDAANNSVQLDVKEAAQPPVQPPAPVNEAPTFTASGTKNVINYTEGTGTKKLDHIESIIAKNTSDNSEWDVYKASQYNLWRAAVEDKNAGTITLDSNLDGSTYSFATTVTVTYYTADDTGTAKTATVTMTW